MRTKIGLYGSGWRAEFFLRVAKALPHKFEIVGVVTRSEEKAERFAREFGVKCYTALGGLLAAEKPDFFVISVTGSKSTEVSLWVIAEGFPVLLETPAAVDFSAPANAKIQVAEQYPFHPMHSARLAFIASGKIGTPVHAQISFSHGYHGMALIRKYLGIGLEMPKITAKSFAIPVIAGYTRDDEPTEEKIVEKTQTVAVLEFEGGKTALYNFETDQHRSWVRSPIIQVKGTRGEIFNNQIKYLHDFKTPLEAKFIRKDMGREENFEGYDLKGIFAAGEWFYRNPYSGSRLVDDEIAIAACLEKMTQYVNGGLEFYSLTEAKHDTYLGEQIVPPPITTSPL